MSMVMVGIDGKTAEVVVATCRMRWRESVASRDVVGDAMVRVTSIRIAMMVPGDGIARQFARWVAFVSLLCEAGCLDVTQVSRSFVIIHLGSDFCCCFR
jgi:hypothetical protein